MAAIDAGIYAICNHRRGEANVGQSRQIGRRWSQHRRDLVGDRHQNPALQIAWRRDRVCSFGLIVLERCTEDRVSNPLDLERYARARRCREAYWLARARAAGVALYNDQVGRRKAA